MPRTAMRIQTILMSVAVLGLTPAILYAQPQPNLDFQAAMQQLGSLMGGGATNAPALVNFRELKALLPADLPGMKRVSANGEKSGAFGMVVSMAEGVYRSEDGAEINIKISDMGGMGGMMAFAQAGWSMAEIDKETETGYERTTTFKGNKAYEKYDNEGKDGEFQAIVNKRFSIEINGQQVTMDQIKAARDTLNLDALAKLQPEAAPSGN